MYNYFDCPGSRFQKNTPVETIRNAIKLIAAL